MIYVFYHNIIEGCQQKAIEEVFESLPINIQSQVLRQKHEKDRNRIIIGKALLIAALETLEIDHCLDEIKYTSHHRPYLSTSLDFNISHSQDFVVCAISKKNRVGIDIEKMEPVNLDDFGQGFSKHDWNYIMTAKDQQQAFYSLWTKRESFLKAIGTGFFQSSEKIDFCRNKIEWNANNWSIQEIFLHKEYCCHLTANQQSPLIQLQEIRLN